MLWGGLRARFALHPAKPRLRCETETVDELCPAPMPVTSRGWHGSWFSLESIRSPAAARSTRASRVGVLRPGGAD